MDTQAKVERVRLALGNLNGHDRRRLVRDTVASVGFPPELEGPLNDLMRIKHVGRATAKEILLAVALRIIEE